MGHKIGITLSVRLGTIGEGTVTMQMQKTETATEMMTQVLDKLSGVKMDAEGQALVALASKLMKGKALVQAHLNGALAVNLSQFEHLNITLKDGPTEEQAAEYEGFVHHASMVS